LPAAEEKSSVVRLRHNEGTLFAVRVLEAEFLL